MARYVVTGGAGFIGSHIVKKLVALGEEVIVIDDLSAGSKENLAPILSSITFIEGSITDVALLQRSFINVDYVLHQAAIASVPKSIEDPLQTHKVNVSGTLHVLQAARDCGVKRVVIASSAAVYGSQETMPIKEDVKLYPLSPYALQKSSVEQYASLFFTLYGLQTVVLRYFNVYGPHQEMSSETSAVIPQFITKALQKEPVTIYGDGNQIRDFVFVDDVVEANLAACTKGQGNGTIINVGSGQPVTINEVARFIFDIVNTPLTLERLDQREGDIMKSVANIEKLQHELSFTPSISLKEGLQKTISSHRGRNDI